MYGVKRYQTIVFGGLLWNASIRTRQKEQFSATEDGAETRHQAQGPGRTSQSAHVAVRGRFAYVAFVVDGFTRCFVGWEISHSLRGHLAVDALEQAIAERLGDTPERPVRHSDCGV